MINIIHAKCVHFMVTSINIFMRVEGTLRLSATSGSNTGLTDKSSTQTVEKELRANAGKKLI